MWSEYKMLGVFSKFGHAIKTYWKDGNKILEWTLNNRTRIAQVAERRARNPEVRGSNPGSG